MSSKRARGAQKKSKKLQALELQQQLKETTKIDSNSIVPTSSNQSLLPISKTICKNVLDDHEKTDDDDENDEDLILIQHPIEFCTEFISVLPNKTSNSLFTLTIPSYETTDDGHIAYSIVLETTQCKWTFQKRYSEFLQFGQFLQLKNITWQLPPKTWFRVTQENALTERQIRLEAACIDLVQREGLLLDPLVRDFFQLDLMANSMMLSTA